ncbi:hypothetical protein IGI04_001930 [Brassica rapa subsp. trilocularis]|uniref:Uncharacterized protein n=1 Tax=Brassica rapa subsp. trilocularis TaxID=1813537 RepID=A0ABQ7NU32_BRACM|nr:hypothetical protein IGI04_001930 [Brassica rapa subsp. trilocularis]
MDRGAKAHVVEGIVLSEFLDLEVQWPAREETLMDYQYIIKHYESRRNHDKLKVSLAMVNRRMRSIWRKARQLKDFQSG